MLTTLGLCVSLGDALALETPSGITNVARLRRDMLPRRTFLGSVLESVNEASLGSGSVCCSGASEVVGDEEDGVHVIKNTPKKVAPHPYKKVTIWWKVAFWKSP